jgi:hypothetical protein
VVGLVVGQVELEQVQTAVDSVDESDLLRQAVEDADAAAADDTGALGDLKMDASGACEGPETNPGRSQALLASDLFADIAIDAFPFVVAGLESAQ